MSRRPFLAFALAAATLGFASPRTLLAADTVTLTIATDRAAGSVWGGLLTDAAARVKKLSGGKVVLKVSTGGTQGDEPHMLKKMRAGSLHAAVLTSSFARGIAPDVSVLDLPRLYRSVEERDVVLEKETPAIEKTFAEKGFVVLAWSDEGNARFFSTSARPTLAEARKSKLAAPQDPETTGVWKALGFSPVSLDPSDDIPSLQTGVVNTLLLTPTEALDLRAHDKAKHMTNLDWAGVTGLVVVEKKAWEGVPDDVRPAIAGVFRDLGKRATVANRKTDALSRMKKSGLEVVEATDVAEWDKAVDAAQASLRTKWVPASVFDGVMQRLAERRKK